MIAFPRARYVYDHEAGGEIAIVDRPSTTTMLGFGLGIVALLVLFLGTILYASRIAG